VIPADTDKPATLTVDECWYPGFTTYVNGKKVPTFKVNKLFRGWTVPAGRSLSYQIYRPASVYFGIIVSVATLCFLMMLFIKKINESDRNDAAP